MRLIEDSVAAMMAVIVIALLAIGCGANMRQAQVAVQTSATSAAAAFDAADDIMSQRLADVGVEVRRQIVEVERVDGEEARRARFDEIMAENGWARIALAMTATRTAFGAFQAMIDAWVDGGELPGDWQARCHDIGVAVTRSIDTIEAAGVDVPSQLAGVGQMTESACVAVSDWVTRMQEDGQ